MLSAEADEDPHDGRGDLSWEMQKGERLGSALKRASAKRGDSQGAVGVTGWKFTKRKPHGSGRSWLNRNLTGFVLKASWVGGRPSPVRWQGTRNWKDRRVSRYLSGGASH